MRYSVRYEIGNDEFFGIEEFDTIEEVQSFMDRMVNNYSDEEIDFAIYDNEIDDYID